MESIGDRFGDAAAKAGEFIDEKTGGKYSDQIQSGVESVQSRLPGGGDASETTEPADEEGDPLPSPIFDSVQQDLNGGPDTE